MDTLDRKLKKTNCSLVHSSKVFQTSIICGTEEGILSLFSAGIWCDVSDRYPGHPQSIDAIEKIDEGTALTGSSEGWFVRCSCVELFGKRVGWS